MKTTGIVETHFTFKDLHFKYVNYIACLSVCYGFRKVLVGTLSVMQFSKFCIATILIILLLAEKLLHAWLHFLKATGSQLKSYHNS